MIIPAQYANLITYAIQHGENYAQIAGELAANGVTNVPTAEEIYSHIGALQSIMAVFNGDQVSMQQLPAQPSPPSPTVPQETPISGGGRVSAGSETGSVTGRGGAP